MLINNKEVTVHFNDLTGLAFDDLAPQVNAMNIINTNNTKSEALKAITKLAEKVEEEDKVSLEVLNRILIVVAGTLIPSFEESNKIHEIHMNIILDHYDKKKTKIKLTKDILYKCSRIQVRACAESFLRTQTLVV